MDVVMRLLLVLAAAPLHEAFRLETLAGDPAAAAALYATLPGEPAAVLGLGRCLERLGRKPEAARAYGALLARRDLDAADAAAALEGIARTEPAWLESREAKPGAWLLSRAEVEEAVAGAFRLMSRLKVEPYLERDGAVGGLLLRSLEADALPARRGLKAYDLIRRINGRPLTSSGAAEIIALLGALKDEAVVEVELERLGNALTLRYEILSPRDLVLRQGPFPEPAFTPTEAPR